VRQQSTPTPIEPLVDPGPDEDEQLVQFLESDQLAEERARPVSRAELSGRAAAGLWALRVLAIVLAAMVIYTFAAQLGSPG
jgi:hypothetical protein